MIKNIFLFFLLLLRLSAVVLHIFDLTFSPLLWWSSWSLLVYGLKSRIIFISLFFTVLSTYLFNCLLSSLWILELYMVFLFNFWRFLLYPFLFCALSSMLSSCVSFYCCQRGTLLYRSLLALLLIFIFILLLVVGTNNQS